MVLLAIELQLCQSETSFEMYRLLLCAWIVLHKFCVKQNLSFQFSDLFEEFRTIFIPVRIFIYISHIN